MSQSDPIHVATNANYQNPTAAVSLQAQSSTPQQEHVTEATGQYAATGPALAAQVQASQATASPLSNSEIRQQNQNPSAPPEQNVRVHARPIFATEHQAKRARVQEASGLEDRSVHLQWLNRIEHRMAVAAQAGLLNETVEKPRYRILAEACQSEDFFYIAFHQALCAWSLNKGPIHALFHGLLEPALLDAAFETAQTILRKNDNMSHANLQWFANFPDPIAQFSRAFPNTDMARDISAFLVQLATSWRTLSQNVKARKYPLLSYELIFILQCRARGLQSMLFTMSRRSLGVPDSHVAITMNMIFERDREDEASYEARGEAPEVLKRARDAVAVKYRELVLSVQQQISSSMASKYPISMLTSYLLFGLTDAAPSPVFGQNAHVSEQHGRQPIQYIPPATANSSHASHATAPSPFLPHFDALTSRASVADPRVANPASANTHSPPPGNTGVRAPRRPNHLHIQTAAAASSPPLATAYQSSQVPPRPLPRSSSAGLPRIRSNHGSPIATHTPILSSNGQPRTPILPPNNPLLQRRAASFAYPSQALPNTYGAQTENQATNPLSVGSPEVSSPVSLINPLQPQTMHSPQYRPVYPQLALQRRASTSQYNTMGPASPTHVYTPQPLGQLNPPYQVPVASYPPPLARPVQQIPESEYPASPYGHGSLQVGLQHVGVRSPRRIPLHSVRGRHYQFVKQLVHQPEVLQPQRGLRSLTFTVSESQLQKLEQKLEGHGLPSSCYFEGSCRYRLRICVQPETQADPSESDWVTAVTCWPNHIFFDLNSRPLELRRKQHFSKDQPLELTDFLIEGKNTLRISYPDVEQNLKPGYKHFVAIEIVTTMSHEGIQDMIQSQQHIATEETREKIQRRLRPSDSDDIIIEDDTLTISLADPFSATRFAIPVRGSQCKHLECFDLETWLQTRPQKPSQKGGGWYEMGSEPSMADAWKCPICGLDARPVSLWVDDYLMGVRRALLSSSDLQTKKITVAPDGNWSPVSEPDTDDDDSPAPQVKVSGMANGHASKHSRPSPATIIEILDDD
ncbi:hypothetical protein F53441_165 [Fusarium austroafricanum]|uniref:SP-RING-type domain-containing protein n=1 Tax=Fusarium austroafricanum TaxID=2364996 RepID=A0A8H4P6L3_9HYPO|nr:hypothetical protein F53441_165 [Fusarium austroafricanum]